MKSCIDPAASLSRSDSGWGCEKHVRAATVCADIGARFPALPLSSGSKQLLCSRDRLARFAGKRIIAKHSHGFDRMRILGKAS